MYSIRTCAMLFLPCFTASAGVIGSCAVFPSGFQQFNNPGFSGACSVRVPLFGIADLTGAMNVSGNALNASFSATAQTDAAVSLGMDASLYTTGPVRPGLVRVFWGPNFLHGPDAPSVQNMTTTIGSLQATCQLMFDPTNCTGSLATRPAAVFPFTLGQIFGFRQELNVGTRQSSLVLESGSYANSYTFTFLESDGTAPVNVFVVPEPGTLFGVAAALALLALRGQAVRTASADPAATRRLNAG